MTMDVTKEQLKGLKNVSVKKLVKTIKSDNEVIFAVPYECVLCDTRLPGIEELIQM